MLELTGNQIKYFLVQKQLSTGVENSLVYNEYNGSFSEALTMVDATRFNLKEQVVSLANLKNEIAKLLSQDFEFKVVKEEITRTELALVEIAPEEDTGEPVEEGEA